MQAWGRSRLVNLAGPCRCRAAVGMCTRVFMSLGFRSRFAPLLRLAQPSRPPIMHDRYYGISYVALDWSLSKLQEIARCWVNMYVRISSATLVNNVHSPRWENSHGHLPSPRPLNQQPTCYSAFDDVSLVQARSLAVSLHALRRGVLHASACQRFWPILADRPTEGIRRSCTGTDLPNTNCGQMRKLWGLRNGRGRLWAGGRGTAAVFKGPTRARS